MITNKELEDNLRIDVDDLDNCLVSQPGLFYHVAEAVAEANSQRDLFKLELEEATAELDQQYRSQALQDPKIKVREGSIESQITIAPRIQKLQREYLAACTKAEHCAALKEAYQQRSFMLRELVAVQLAQFHNLGVERGATSARHHIGDRVREEQEQMRRGRFSK